MVTGDSTSRKQRSTSPRRAAGEHEASRCRAPNPGRDGTARTSECRRAVLASTDAGDDGPPVRRGHWRSRKGHHDGERGVAVAAFDARASSLAEVTILARTYRLGHRLKSPGSNEITQLRHGSSSARQAHAQGDALQCTESARPRGGGDHRPIIPPATAKRSRARGSSFQAAPPAQRGGSRETP